ncbi:hypothetical protein JTB14_014225 [Gonioctena quinquepunctata]|nr:hypothetical protein JTB14_014225 [Gonioctena quinquepunctata]
MPQNNTDDRMVFLEKTIIELTKCPESQLDRLKHTLSHFKCVFKRRWEAVNYTHERFLKINEQCLENTHKFAMRTIGKPGRPSKEFGESSKRFKIERIYGRVN